MRSEGGLENDRRLYFVSLQNMRTIFQLNVFHCGIQELLVSKDESQILICGYDNSFALIENKGCAGATAKFSLGDRLFLDPLVYQLYQDKISDAENFIVSQERKLHAQFQLLV